MFTRTGDRSTIDMSVAMGTDATTELIGDVEQDAALLASEDNDFLIRMGVSRKLLTDVMYQHKAVKGSGPDQSTRRCLTREAVLRSEEHTSELQSLMRHSYAVFRLKKNN